MTPVTTKTILIALAAAALTVATMTAAEARITNIRVNANGITGGGPIPANAVAHQAHPDFWRSAYCRHNPINCNGKVPGTYALQ